jgi:diguanylate cyclase (GGDEF)-like protein
MSANQRRPLLLIVDDDPVNLHLLSQGLQDDFRTRTADSGARALEAAAERERPELILLDVRMPEMDGYEVCRRLKLAAATRDIPVIFVTSMSDEAAEMRGLAVGAVDFIAKPVNLRVTRARILTHINLKRNQDRLARLSREDALTGIANRRSFDETLTHEWRRSARTSSPLALVMVDVDYFKQYNDAYGHAAGDACLKRIAEVLSGTVRRPTDLAARYGGEEFAALLADTPQEGASRIAEAVRTGIDRLAIPHAAAPTGRVTVSCGVGVVVPTAHMVPAELISAADRKLYAAKAEGRNRVAV